MKINLNSSMNVYQKREPTVTERGPGATRGSLDRAEFSRGGAAALDRPLMGAKASIQSAVNAPATPARLEELRQSVRDGSYHVSNEELVRAFLNLDA